MRARRSGVDGRFVVIGIVAVVAFLVRLRLITHGAGIAASDGYDDGVYYAAADELVHGRLPYRDFLLLHPPGIVLALSPFAALGAALGDPVGVTAARLAFLGIGAANCALVAILAGRHSRTATVVAGGAAAIFFPLAYAERSTLLEPLGTMLLLIAVLAVRRPSTASAVLAGVAAGAAIDVKIWFVVPAVVVLVSARARWLPVLAGLVGGGAVIAAPFFLAAPASMLREVVLDQLGRPVSQGASTVVRIVTIAADPRAGAHGAAAVHRAEVVAAAVIVLFVTAGLAALRVRWARVFVVLAIATNVVLLASPSFFTHYVGFSAPWMMIVLGIGCAEATRRLRRRGLRAAVAVVVLAVVAGASAHADLATTVVPQPAAALATVPGIRAGCVVSDDPGLLADADLLSMDLSRGCRFWPDVTGATYDRDRSVGHRAANRRWQRDAVGYLTSGAAVVLDRRGTGLSAASRATIAALPVLARVGDLVVHRTR